MSSHPPGVRRVRLRVEQASPGPGGIETLRYLFSRSSGRVALMVFDQEQELVYAGPASAAGERILERVRKRGALGATDLAAALRAVSSKFQSGSFRRVVLVSDGIVTLGENQPQRLKQLVKTWAGHGVRRLDAVATSSTYHDSLLRELTTAGLPEHGVVVTAASSFDTLIRLERRTVSDRVVIVAGAAEQVPKVLRGFEPGDLALIYAHVPNGGPLKVRVSGVPIQVADPSAAFYPLLSRLFPSRGIGAPTKHPEDALGEQLEIRDGRLEAIVIRHRPPTCRCGSMRFSGRLPPEVIQRILRSNYGRFRGCYAKALLSNPGLAGRVVVRFVIGPVGHVLSVHDEGSTLDSSSTTQCIMEAFSRIEFPMPEGGQVSVVYPLRLYPEGGIDDSENATASSAAGRVELADPDYALTPRDAREEAYIGGFSDVMTALREARLGDARTALVPFEHQARLDLVSVLARGRVAEASRDFAVARRAYGSMLDLYLGDPAARRFAAAHWMRQSDPGADALVSGGLDSRQPTEPEAALNQRQLAWHLVKRGEHRRALELLMQALQGSARTGNDPSLQILFEDVAMVARAVLAKSPAHQQRILGLLKGVGVQPATDATLRFFLVAEHGEGLSLGLYTESSKGRVRGREQWFGPHQAYFVASKERRDPYRVHVRYLPDNYVGPNAIPYGYVEIVEQDSRGTIRVDHRPFVFQTPRTEVDLGTYGDAG